MEAGATLQIPLHVQFVKLILFSLIWFIVYDSEKLNWYRLVLYDSSPWFCFEVNEKLFISHDDSQTVGISSQDVGVGRGN